MINMGHVRFENTYLALEECVEDLHGNKAISPSENEYRLSLYEKCKEYITACDGYVYKEEPEDDF